jgi:hypothetical protein
LAKWNHFWNLNLAWINASLATHLATHNVMVLRKAYDPIGMRERGSHYNGARLSVRLTARGDHPLSGAICLVARGVRK